MEDSMKIVSWGIRFSVPVVAAFSWAETAPRSQESFGKVSEEVNKKVVKLYGSGGFQGLASYGTGVLFSPEGHILTVASHMLATQDLRVPLYDGRRYHA